MMDNVKIVFASGNKHKIEEFAAILKKYLPNAVYNYITERGLYERN